MSLLKSALKPRTQVKNYLHVICFTFLCRYASLSHSDLQVIWMTTPPISVDIRSGLLIKETKFQRHSMRFNIMEANQCAANIVAAHGFDVLGK